MRPITSLWIAPRKVRYNRLFFYRDPTSPIIGHKRCIWFEKGTQLKLCSSQETARSTRRSGAAQVLIDKHCLRQTYMLNARARTGMRWMSVLYYRYVSDAYVNNRDRGSKIYDSCCSHINSSPQYNIIQCSPLVAGQAPITLEWKNTSEKIKIKQRIVHMITEPHRTPQTKIKVRSAHVRIRYMRYAVQVATETEKTSA